MAPFLKLSKEYRVVSKTWLKMRERLFLTTLHHFSFRRREVVLRSESAYQAKLIKKLEQLFPGCHIQKNNASENQGIPDILILIGSQWAMLEIKLSNNSPRQPNQEYYVDKFDGMSFAAFISPENEEQVLNDLQSTFGAFR